MALADMPLYTMSAFIDIDNGHCAQEKTPPKSSNLQDLVVNEPRSHTM